jgi:tRNA (guanine-N7-)-methyltransferase
MPEKRVVRSYVLRTGRLTPGQARALESLWPRYGRDFSGEALDLERLFGRSAPKVLEIGFGSGDTLVQLAAENPDVDYLGVEVHPPGVGRCLMQAEKRGVDNLRVIAHDAVAVLHDQIIDGSLWRINLYFPDPWPKKRHHKRRILQADFLQLAASKLEPGGSLHIATDWADYAAHIDEVLAACETLEVAERREHSGENALDRPTTRFEKRGLNRGHRITDWRVLKI